MAKKCLLSNIKHGSLLLEELAFYISYMTKTSPRANLECRNDVVNRAGIVTLVYVDAVVMNLETSKRR